MPNNGWQAQPGNGLLPAHKVLLHTVCFHKKDLAGMCPGAKHNTRQQNKQKKRAHARAT